MSDLTGEVQSWSAYSTTTTLNDRQTHCPTILNIFQNEFSLTYRYDTILHGNFHTDKHIVLGFGLTDYVDLLNAQG